MSHVQTRPLEPPVWTTRGDKPLGTEPELKSNPIRIIEANLDAGAPSP
jgi:hypothetical protein